MPAAACHWVFTRRPFWGVAVFQGRRPAVQWRPVGELVRPGSFAGTVPLVQARVEPPGLWVMVVCWPRRSYTSFQTGGK